jgi:hypothetical protein
MYIVIDRYRHFPCIYCNIGIFHNFKFDIILYLNFFITLNFCIRNIGKYVIFDFS